MASAAPTSFLFVITRRFSAEGSASHYARWNDSLFLAPQAEAIEFSGCDYDENALRVGRLYYQPDQLIGDALWPKRKDFVTWAERVFVRTKQMLTYSRELTAYVGKNAEEWRRNGGRFEEM